MRFIFFISFFILLSCNNQKQEKQEKLRSELAILSQAISTSPNNPAHYVTGRNDAALGANWTISYNW